jgi:DinB superfamily
MQGKIMKGKQELSESEKRAGIRAQIEEEHQAWLNFLLHLPPGELRRTPEGTDWSALETFIHVTAWQENALKVARGLADGTIRQVKPSNTPAGILHIDLERFNAEILVSHKDWSLEQVLEWNKKVSSDLREALDRLPADKLFGGRNPFEACSWFARPAIIHSRGHRKVAERSHG